MKNNVDIQGKIREVLDIEKQSIADIIAKVDKNYQQVVELFYNSKGRIVVTGIGKPGIIGRKFSATLASTGTPSLCVHPVEAVHGDLGMILKEDIVVAISNSGESEEVVKLIPLVKKLGATLVGMTGNSRSSLAKYSDIFIDIGISKEACPFGLVPTSSTTAALAVCDAIAVALLELKGFNLKDYAFYHPGGAIGKKLIKVKDIMRTGDKFAVVDINTKVSDVLVKITEAKAGSATVIGDTGKVLGIFTDGDLRRSLREEKDILGKPVKLFMTDNPLRINTEELVMKALNTIREKNIDEIIVVDENDLPVGIIDEKDMLGIA